MYGYELVMDLYECNVEKFTVDIVTKFMEDLCDLIDMKRADLHIWSNPELLVEPHTKGISAIQFIYTSNVTLHTLDILKELYINLFTCKAFDVEVAKKFIADTFEAKSFDFSCFPRGKCSLRDKSECIMC